MNIAPRRVGYAFDFSDCASLNAETSPHTYLLSFPNGKFNLTSLSGSDAQGQAKFVASLFGIAA